MAKFKAAADISNVDDIVLKHSANLIQQLLVDLRSLISTRDTWPCLTCGVIDGQDEGLKRFEAALAVTPIGYFWGVHTELSPEILWIGDRMERLKAKLLALNDNTTGFTCSCG